LLTAIGLATAVSCSTTNLAEPIVLVVPTSKRPLESMRARSEPPVDQATVSAAGKKVPVLVSDPWIAGVEAEPSGPMIPVVPLSVIGIIL
jgi:hypothetical protein